jgi:hypothetical protein
MRASLGRMYYDVPLLLGELAERQRGVLCRRQLLSGGLSDHAVGRRVGRGQWQRLHTGVYAAFSGNVDRQAVLWAAVLRAGQGAVLSHQTAAEVDQLTDKPSPLIHVTVPGTRRVSRIRGTVVHVRQDVERIRHPSRLPPRTRLEDTVLDLTNECTDAADAVGWITRALGRRLTTQDLLRRTAGQRLQLRWRAEINAALAPDMAGLHSALEYRYHRGVERPHRLPASTRQVRAVLAGRNSYRDVLYDGYGLAVELDGDAAHPGDTRWLDIERDNAAAADGLVTLRFSYWDVTLTPCLVAAQVSQVLRLRGWNGSPRRCSADCPVA